MKKVFSLILVSLILVCVPTGCKKTDNGKDRLAQFAREINEAPDKELSNGTVLTGCEYNIGDTLFTYNIKVIDNRYDKVEADSIKRSFTKTVKSDSMSKIVNLLNKTKVGLKYRLILPEKEVTVEFPSAELQKLSGKTSN